MQTSPASASAPSWQPPWWWYAAVLRRLRPAGARLLQVDCGTGELLQLVVEHYETYGFDVRPRQRSQCRMNVASAVVLEEWEERPESGFDVVVSVGAFGLRGARAQVRGLLTALAPGGALVLIVPNSAGWAAQRKGRGWGGGGGRVVDGEPLLAPGEWKTVLRQLGLELRAALGDGLWEPPYVAWAPAALQRTVCDAALSLRSALPIPLAWSSARFGERMILVAERAPGA